VLLYKKTKETMDKPKIAGTAPIRVSLEKGKKYAWCSCGLSDNQPFCNGTHKGSGFKPVVFEATEDKDVNFCTCKATNNEMGYCDGSHKSL